MRNSASFEPLSVKIGPGMCMDKNAWLSKFKKAVVFQPFAQKNPLDEISPNVVCGGRLADTINCDKFVAIE